MKIIKNIMVVGLFLAVGIGFARDNFAEKGQNIIDAINSFDSESHSNWTPTGPTAEDIQAATKVKNLAAKGSLEDKLINAAINGDSKTVKAHIIAGADLEARDKENMTALMIAAERGYTEIVKILIGAGARVDSQDRFGCTAFFKAADKNHADIVKILIATGAAVETDSLEGLFMRAAHEGNTEMVKALLMVESPQIRKRTLNDAYMIARSSSNPEILNLIAEALNKKSQ